MACSHAQTCPLFPHLRASLAGWKTSYCDSTDKWSECARHRASAAGKAVPITLLPNGTNISGVTQGAKPAAAVAVLEDPALPTTVPQSWWRRLFGRSS
jgi:hypothetical protein